MVLWRPTRSSRTNTQKDVLFIIGDQNAKVGSQEILEVTGKFVLGVQTEVGQRLTEFWEENTHTVLVNTLFQQHKRRLHMDIIRWSILKSDWLYSLQPKMEKLYSQQKQDRELQLLQSASASPRVVFSLIYSLWRCPVDVFVQGDELGAILPCRFDPPPVSAHI